MATAWWANIDVGTALMVGGDDAEVLLAAPLLVVHRLRRCLLTRRVFRSEHVDFILGSTWRSQTIG